jgi:PIN domain nuclease of toxin-antitoxin system
MSIINVSEFFAVLMRKGSSDEEALRIFRRLGISIRSFSFEDALAAARLSTMRPELSLGDRACLVTAAALGVPALTADRSWQAAPLTIAIELIR